jgi:uncharacterized protein DUF4350
MKLFKRWRRWLAAVVAVIATALCFFWLTSDKGAAVIPVKWTPQPDSFPLGAVLQGGSVEMSLGLFSDIRPKTAPAWSSRLPQPIRRLFLGTLEHLRAGSSKRKWRIQVEAPAFLHVDRSEIDYHSSHGVFPTVTLRLATDRPGTFAGQLSIRLLGDGHGTNIVSIPVAAKVLAQPPRWTVLATETPFERYATGNGRDYEPLTAVTTRLAERGVRIDFLHDLPKSLNGWNVILLGGSTLTDLQAGSVDRLQEFVAKGGRLIVAADAFFVGTAPKANDLLNRHGLHMASKDAGRQMQTSRITPDPLTAGVSELSFFRPARVWATDSQRAKVLATMKDDEEFGFIAVSRSSGRGDVVLLAQSLWWSWAKADSEGNDNARMFENLLAP